MIYFSQDALQLWKIYWIIIDLKSISKANIGSSFFSRNLTNMPKRAEDSSTGVGLKFPKYLDQLICLFFH